METSSSRSLVDEDRVLKGLLEVFGSTFSLRAIASAFVKAGHNAELAAEFLSDSQETTSDEPITHASNTETSVASSSEQLSESIVDDSTHAGRNYKASKPKKNSVSMGTVSCVLGKGYPRSITSATEISEAYKPLKVDVTGLPMDELFKEDTSSNSTVRSDNMHKDTEDFLFKMLGKGFQLDMNLIREVLGCCGYDAKKSMEKLMDISAPTLKKSDDIISGSTGKFADKYPEPKSPISQEKSQYNGFAKSPLPSQDKERYDLQREVLASLFTVPERFEEIPRRGRPIRAIKKTRSVGKVVFEPPRDTSPVHSTAIVESQHDTEDEKEEENYQVLRRAAKEHWNTMKEYYKAAVEAFVNGDLIKADKLQEEGQHFNNKAREADEKSAQATLQRRKKESQDDLTIDLHDHDKKEAISMLKLQLTNLSGIPSFQYLKVILETDAEDTSKGSRKRLVLKLLERESIKWTEDEKNPGAILIKLDEINPKNLSFGKKAL